MQIDVTFHLPPSSGEPTEIRTLTLPLHSPPRAGELVNLDVRLDTGERVQRSIRVKDINWSIRHNPDAGPPNQTVNVFSA